jgi:hypothetical protein
MSLGYQCSQALHIRQRQWWLGTRGPADKQLLAQGVDAFSAVLLDTEVRAYWHVHRNPSLDRVLTVVVHMNSPQHHAFSP